MEGVAPLRILWLKRDLRVDDHRALLQALDGGPVLGLFVFEDGLLELPDTDPSHVAWQIRSLHELRIDWEQRGGWLCIRRGEIVDILEGLRREFGVAELFAHEETGNAWTYARDLRVEAWCSEHGVRLDQSWQYGVVRHLESRDGWSKLWNQRMATAPADAPEWIEPPEGDRPTPGEIPTLEELGMAPSSRTEIQDAGERAARATLESFLLQRGINYRADMSSPVEGWEGCSRISTYLAWGNLSMRRVHHEARARVAELKARKAATPKDADESFPSTWLPSLSSFQSRLRWHCHFMQKFEDQPDLETEEMNRAYKGMRDGLRDQTLLDAYDQGRTGYPMVDACMRCLHATGWINFRMRAMLVSFGTHHLGQPWQDIGNILAPLFLDYEPGIHWSQTQMQAGVTGINTVRIYSPIKQVSDQDPEGVFVRRWVPELEGVPKKRLPEPHKMTAQEQDEAGCRIGRDYPEPIVDHKTAYAAAKDRIWAVRKTAEARDEAKRVYQKHGSRKRPMRRRS